MMGNAAARMYKLGSEFYKRIYIRFIVAGLAIMVMMVAIIVFSGIYSSQGWGSALILFFQIFGLVGVGILIATRQQVRQWSNYQIFFENDFIVRIHPPQPVMRIALRAITHVYEFSDRSLLVTATNSSLNISIPAGLEMYQDVRETLGNWCVIELASSIQPSARKMLAKKAHSSFLKGLLSWLVQNKLVSIGLPIIGALISFVSNDPIVLVFIGTPTFLCLVGALVLLQRSPVVSEALKRTSLAVMLPIAVLLFKVILGFMLLFNL